MTKAQLMEVSVLVAGSAPKRVDCGGHSVTTAELGSTLSVAATACPNLARWGVCCVCERMPSTACVCVCRVAYLDSAEDVAVVVEALNGRSVIPLPHSTLPGDDAPHSFARR